MPFDRRPVAFPKVEQDLDDCISENWKTDFLPPC